MNNKEKINDYLEQTKNISIQELFQFIEKEFGDKVTFASSLGEEDQVITDIISKASSQMNIFTLDTGRLFSETYELLGKTQKKYPMNFKIFYPDTSEAERMVKDKGINLFYESIENRKLCCNVRKVYPLKRALKSVDAWICGLRRSQSVTRTDIEVFEWDEGNRKIKINPLIHWSYQEVKNYIKDNNIDINPLHQKGFLSIGCACCTRAVKEGEDIRAGRWWWEDPDKKECGLHNNPNRPKVIK